jgi:Spy/CpxP family protein refolding chaperone
VALSDPCGPLLAGCDKIKARREEGKASPAPRERRCGREKGMLKKRTIIGILFLAVATTILSGCYRTPEQKAEHMVSRLATELKLNDVQKAQMEKIKDEFLARRPAEIRQREESIKEANALMRSEVIDKTRLDALVAKNEAEVDDMLRFVSAKFTEIHDMLTPEQREKLVSLIEKHMK